jgi:hypothetical protein
MAAARVIFVHALLCSPAEVQAESISRSDPQTPGEKRLLEWDLNKTYDLSKSRTNTGAKAASRPFLTQPFAAGGFSAKSFSAASFSSPEFLTPENKMRPAPFATRPASVGGSPQFVKPFQPGSAADNTLKAFGASSKQTGEAQKAFPDSARSFQGPEAARKEQKFSPETAPRGGVFEGRKLSPEEVREILNKSR